MIGPVSGINLNSGMALKRDRTSIGYSGMALKRDRTSIGYSGMTLKCDRTSIGYQFTFGYIPDTGPDKAQVFGYGYSGMRNMALPLLSRSLLLDG